MNIIDFIFHRNKKKQDASTTSEENKEISRNPFLVV